MSAFGQFNSQLSHLSKISPEFLSPLPRGDPRDQFMAVSKYSEAQCVCVCVCVCFCLSVHLPVCVCIMTVLLPQVTEVSDDDKENARNSTSASAVRSKGMDESSDEEMPAFRVS